jgi:hypothetical protein
MKVFSMPTAQRKGGTTGSPVGGVECLLKSRSVRWAAMALRGHLTGEVAEDWLDGLRTCHEAVRRPVLLLARHVAS